MDQGFCDSGSRDHCLQQTQTQLPISPLDSQENEKIERNKKIMIDFGPIWPHFGLLHLFLHLTSHKGNLLSFFGLVYFLTISKVWR